MSSDPEALPVARIPPRLVRANAWPAWAGAAVCGFGGLALWLMAGPHLEPTIRLLLMPVPLIGVVICAGMARSTLRIDDEGVAITAWGERLRTWPEIRSWEARERAGERWVVLRTGDGGGFVLPPRFFTGEQSAHLRFGLVRRLGPPTVDEWIRTAPPEADTSVPDADDEPR